MKKVSLALFASLMAAAGMSFAQSDTGIAETNDPAAAAAIEQHAQELNNQQDGSSAAGASGTMGSDAPGSAGAMDNTPGVTADPVDPNNPSAQPADPYANPETSGASGSMGAGDMGAPGAEAGAMPMEQPAHNMPAEGAGSELPAQQ